MFTATPYVSVEESSVRSQRNGIDQKIIALRPTTIKKRLRSSDIVAGKLGIAILSGAYQPGHRFADEVAFSKQLNVGRSIYRDAIRILTERGLVAPSPKIGTVVTPRQYWNLLDPLVVTWTFSGEPDLNLLESLFETRMLIESSTAALAAVRRSEEQLRRLQNALQQMERLTPRMESGLQAERDFHITLLQCASNPYIASLAGSVAAAVEASARYKQRYGAVLRDPVPEHAGVFYAIENKDAETAKRKMEQLIRQAFLDMPLL